MAAEEPGTILVADTSAVLTDETVDLVMKGYELIAAELLEQAENRNFSHLFVQAGVGGLAAALAGTIRPKMVGQRKVVIVEPENAACVGAALAAGRAVSIKGDLDTSANMLSCGLASTPALEILLASDADAIRVSEPCLEEACALMEAQGIKTTPSGAAGLAGLLSASRDPAHRRRFGLEPESAALLIVSEGRP
jgi:diaminopropionate ammonia-lyase